MRERRRLIAVSFLICIFGVLACPSSAEAGPLLDWLFHRNRSQGLADAGNRPYAANYRGSTRNFSGNYTAGNYTYPTAGNPPERRTARYGGTNRGLGSCLGRGCLFGRRNDANSRPGSGGLTTANRTTAGYAPGQARCGPGWCQQTVVRYVPQIAYRTEYHPVPVTTYKTTTTINPQNGLPRTCTRPCTSYTNQARRVPYTTYRPVYTTVPVTDDLAQPRQTQFAPPQTYAPQSASACSSCQGSQVPSGALAPSQGSGWSALPLAPRTTPWGSQSGAYSDAPAGATPWQPRNGGSAPVSDYGSNPYGGGGANPTEWQRDPGTRVPEFGAGSADATDIPWQRLPSNGMVSPPGSIQGNEADRRPALRVTPDSDTGYYSNRAAPQRSRSVLKPIPMPEDIRQRLGVEPAYDSQPSRRIDQVDEQTRFRTEYQDPYGADPYIDASQKELANSGYSTAVEPHHDDALFATPQRPLDRLDPPLTAPSNHVEAVETQETRRNRYRSRAILDPERSKPAPPVRQDKTAAVSRRAMPKVSRPVHEDDAPRATRYAAVPIDWSKNRKSQSQSQERRWRNVNPQVSKQGVESRPSSRWRVR